MTWLASCFLFSFLCPCSVEGQLSCGSLIPQFILEVSASSWSLHGPDWLARDFSLALSRHLSSLCWQSCGCISTRCGSCPQIPRGNATDGGGWGFFKETYVKPAVQAFCGCGTRRKVWGEAPGTRGHPLTDSSRVCSGQTRGGAFPDPGWGRLCGK